MSHTIKSSEVKLDQAAVEKAAQHLGWKVRRGQNRLFDGTETNGLIVALPGWRYELTVQADGSLVYDNYRGRWGDVREVEKLMANSMAVMAEADWPVYEEETNQWVMEVN